MDLQNFKYTINRNIMPFIQVGLGLLGANRARRAQREAQQKAEQEAQAALERQQAAQLRVDEQRARYLKYQFENPFEGMENPFEDLTVSTKAFDLQKEFAQQQAANVLAGLRGTAGASGIAGLAQGLANQGVIQARTMAADIAKQEAENQRIMAKGTLMFEQLQRSGDAAVQQAESAREATILGMEYGALTGALGAQQQAQQNLMYQDFAGMQIGQQNIAALAGLAGTDGPLQGVLEGLGIIPA